jgi:hypothetical protein
MSGAEFVGHFNIEKIKPKRPDLHEQIEALN